MGRISTHSAVTRWQLRSPPRLYRLREPYFATQPVLRKSSDLATSTGINLHLNSLIRRLLERPGIVTPSATDQSVDPGGRQFYGWVVDWLDEDLDGAVVLDAGCFNAAFGVYLRTSRGGGRLRLRRA